MFKRLIAAVLVATSIVGLAGCQTMPQNAAVGAIAGGAFGAIAGDNRRSAARGAVAGGILGAIFLPTAQQGYPVQQTGYPVQQQGYMNQGMAQQASCPANSTPTAQGCMCNPGTTASGNACVPVQQQYQQPVYQNQPQQGVVCGPAAYNLPYPSIAIPGTACRRPQ